MTQRQSAGQTSQSGSREYGGYIIRQELTPNLEERSTVICLKSRETANFLRTGLVP
jgi:hypothetical protein